MNELTEEEKMWYILQGYTIDIDTYKNIHFYLDNKLHRHDGPAVIFVGKKVEYYLNGKCHRTDGPAIIYKNGAQFYYVDGKYLSKDTFNQLYKSK